MVAKTRDLTLIPVMLCFFAMGFVDLVGIASNYVKEDLQLTDSVANIFPSLVFFWFLIFSVPTGMLMNKLGRKNTVMLSLIVTILSLLIPLFGESFTTMLIAFSLLGIGNALMQTSLNPLVATVMDSGRSQDNHLASTLTFGQFIKAIASFLAPYLAMWGATHVIPTFGFDWRILFGIYFLVGIMAAVMLGVTPILEDINPLTGPQKSVAEQFTRCRLCHESLFHLPYHRLSVGFVLPTHPTQPYVLHYQRVDDGALDVRSVLRHGGMDALHSYCPGGVRQLQYLLHLLCPGTHLST